MEDTVRGDKKISPPSRTQMHTLAKEGAGQKVTRHAKGLMHDKKFPSSEKEKGRDKKRRKRGERFPSPSREEERQHNYFSSPLFLPLTCEREAQEKMHEQEGERERGGGSREK